MYRETKYTITLSNKASQVDGKPWRFLTNHTQVLLCIARDRNVRTRDIAEMVGITERAAQRIVADLVEADFVTVERGGRRGGGGLGGGGGAWGGGTATRSIGRPRCATKHRPGIPSGSSSTCSSS